MALNFYFFVGRKALKLIMENKKKVVIGVCGGIAAYKAAELISLLKKNNFEVFVVMTKSATEFISPLTLQTLSQNKVYVDMFETPTSWEVEHISLAQNKDLFVVIPATANVIGKVANGIADDFLTTTIMATKSRVVFCPAMNTNMYENPIVIQNMEKLKSLGYSFIEPACGRLACGDVGKGKLANVSTIFENIVDLTYTPKDMLNKKVLVTAGPTKEYIDPVRFISNGSSGKMGYAIAKAARLRGAEVTLISGETNLSDISGVNIIKVVSADDMLKEVLKYAKWADIIIKSAAVSDFKSKNIYNNKVKKDEINSIELIKNPDILKELSKHKENFVLVGFCMETQNLVENAQKKLISKNLDLIVANNLNEEGAGFGVDTNIVKIIDSDGNVFDVPKMEKEKLAHIILDKAISIN